MFCVEENLQQAFASFTLQFGEMGITDQFVFSRFSRGGVCDGKFLSLILSLNHSFLKTPTSTFGIRLADSQITTGIFPTGTIPFATDDELVFVSLHHRRYLGHRVLLCLGAFQICRAC